MTALGVRHRQRGRELVLLVFAAVIVTVALVLTEATQNRQLSWQLLELGRAIWRCS